MGTITAVKNGCWIGAVDEITANLEEYDESMREQVEHGLKSCAGEVMKRAVRLCPAVTGELRARSFQTDPMNDESDETKPCIYVGFEQFGAKTGQINGKTAGKDYAVPVHERTYARHDTGQAKFLEAAVNDFTDEYLEAMQTYCKDAKPDGGK